MVYGVVVLNVHVTDSANERLGTVKAILVNDETIMQQFVVG